MSRLAIIVFVISPLIFGYNLYRFSVTEDGGYFIFLLLYGKAWFVLFCIWFVLFLFKPKREV